MLDVLMYLFEHYMDESAMITTDHDNLESCLSDVGFSNNEIRKALSWLDGLNRTGHTLPVNCHRSIRLYTNQETTRLSSECRGYIQFLEHSGILTPDCRELVIDRALALENDDIDLDKLKWVILMVLFNQPQQCGHKNRMEDLIFSEPAASIH